ncbi:hypothetical protein VE02_06956 [Pseudogymnoascus sp. 03VT05]|nr:hypothetical protein VE02_06956 [Pseudogymnoascus sp. 03VT05]
MGADKGIYHPQDAIGAAITGTMITGGAGLFMSAVQNALARKNVGPWGVFTRSGSTIAVFAAMGGTYEFTKFAAANLRQKNDSLNPALGGLLAGSVLGFKQGSLPAVLGYGTMAAVLLGAFDYTGGRINGWNRDPEADEFERKQYMRKNRRRPIEETISEVGEGRGVYGPGYLDRRKERIKEAYGIDVPGESS